MDYIRYLIEQIVLILLHEKETYTKMIRTGPEGGIICDRSKGEKGKYLHSVPMGRNTAERNEYQRRSLAGNPELLAALATKEYARVALKIIDHNLDILTKAMNALLPMDPGSIRGRMRRTYQTLPDPCFEPIRRAKETVRRQHEWAEEPYHQSAYREHEKIHTTTRGLRVRSAAGRRFCRGWKVRNTCDNQSAIHHLTSRGAASG